MFGTNFFNLTAFLTPTSLFFASTLLGLLPPLFTQIFLLRRILLFLSSLEVLWPILVRRPVQLLFTGVMCTGMLLGFGAGVASCIIIWRSGQFFQGLVIGHE